MAERRKAGRGLLLSAFIIVILSATACAATGAKTVRAGDWQYAALDRLAQVGLLSGYPKAPLGTLTDRLSRFEAAALTLRAVQGLGKAYQAQGKALELAAAPDESAGEGPVDEPEAAAPAAEAPPAPIEGLNAENLAMVQKLVEEFRTELVTMEGRIDYIQTVLTETQQRLTKVEAERKQHQIDGYLQVRFRDDGATAGKQEFLIRRARVNLRGPVSARASYRLEFQMDAKDIVSADGASKGAGSKVQLRYAYMDYKLDNALLRIGQAKLPWGYELQDSSAELWAAERALFMDRLFPDQRDIGVLANYRRSPQAPAIDVGVVNGTGINASDDNRRKNLVARVDFPLRAGSVAVSGYSGASGAGASETRQDRYGLSARYGWAELQFQGEFVTGNDKGKDVRGHYWQLGHPLGPPNPNLLFLKYDQFDEDRAKADDMFKRWSLGYWYDLDKATRLTLVYELRQADPAFSELTKWNGNAGYVQLQVKF